MYDCSVFVSCCFSPKEDDWCKTMRFRTHLLSSAEPEFVNLLRSPGIDSKPGGPVRQPYLTYRPDRLHELAESIPWNRFLGSLNVYNFGL
jgi:hypothetical protein